jgi:hypothetical protein
MIPFSAVIAIIVAGATMVTKFHQMTADIGTAKENIAFISGRYAGLEAATQRQTCLLEVRIGQLERLNALNRATILADQAQLLQREVEIKQLEIGILRIAASLGGNKRIATDARKRLPFAENALARTTEQARKADIEASTAAEAAMERKAAPARSDCEREPRASQIPIGHKQEVVASLQTFLIGTPAGVAQGSP